MKHEWHIGGSFGGITKTGSVHGGEFDGIEGWEDIITGHWETI